MIRKFSLSETGRKYKLSKNFTLGEFACKDGSDEVRVSEELVNLLEEVRAWARLKVDPNAIVIVASGYRTETYNAQIPGAAKNSFHCKGAAADFKIWTQGGFVSPAIIYEALDNGEVSEWTGGLGLYKTWVHVDTRGKKARWHG